MNKKCPIYDSLKEGKENTIDAKTLCEMHNFSSIRQLQNMIAKERKSGAIIISNTSGGYYRSTDRKEIADFIATLESRAKHTMAALKSARKYLKQIENQMSIDDYI